MYRWYGRHMEMKRQIERFEQDVRSGRPWRGLREHLPTKRDAILVLVVLGTLALFGLALQGLGY